MKSKIARIYGRFSSKGQEDGSSREDQIGGAIKYAERHGYTLMTGKDGKPLVYFDEAVSGKEGKNLEREFGRLLKEAKQGEFVLCAVADRLGRQHPVDVLNIIRDEILARGLSIVFHKRDLVVDAESINNPAVLFGLFGETTVSYSDNTRKMERLVQTNALALAEGEKGVQSGTVAKYLPQCYVWDALNKKILIDEERAKVIRRIFKMFNDGMGKTQICQTLNAEGVPTPYVGKGQQIGERKPWLETSVKKILRNESYAGVMRVKGKTITCFEPVVKREVFDKAQLVQMRYVKHRGDYKTDKINNIFRGIAFCKYCKGTVNVNVSPQQTDKEGVIRKTEYHGYRCKNARLKSCAAKGLLNAKMVELGFFAHFLKGTPENLWRSQTNELKSQAEALQTKIEKINSAISNLMDMAEGAKKEELSEIQNRIQKRRMEKSGVESELSLLKGSIVETEELPNAIDEIDALFGSPEGNQALNQFFPNLEKTLADNETRKKLVALLPTAYSRVEFDFANKSVEVFKSVTGESLGKIDVKQIQEVHKALKAFSADTQIHSVMAVQGAFTAPKGKALKKAA